MKKDSFDEFLEKYIDFRLSKGLHETEFRLYAFENTKFSFQYYFTDHYESIEELKAYLKIKLGMKKYQKLMSVAIEDKT